jgi:hypothetical protein
MNLLNEHVVAATSQLPPSVYTQMQHLGKRVFIAGGFLRAIVARETPNDIDIFSQPGVDSKKLADQVAVTTELGEIVELDVHATSNAYSVDTKPVSTQVIRGWNFKTPFDCIKDFDFTICQAAIWWDVGSWNSVCSDSFYPDLAARRLRYTRPVRAEANAMTTAIRVLKFYERGYVIDTECFSRIIEHAAPTKGDIAQLVNTASGLITRKTKTY